ncbi:ABC transporter permease [Bifidobacterium psychraerophilum]|nr:ABC transporter permease [Bifidobacterium psychraerophilum]
MLTLPRDGTSGPGLLHSRPSPRRRDFDGRSSRQGSALGSPAPEGQTPLPDESSTHAIAIRPTPWYSPQVLIPMEGMMLGNLVAALAVAMSRFFSDMEARRHEIEAYLSLGASPFEAAKPSILAAIRLGLIPTIAQLASSGVVLIPGMMAGQIMTGGDPLEAAEYQFVVLAALSAITMLGDALITLLLYQRCFTELGQYISPRAR